MNFQFHRVTAETIEEVTKYLHLSKSLPQAVTYRTDLDLGRARILLANKRENEINFIPRQRPILRHLAPQRPAFLADTLNCLIRAQEDLSVYPSFLLEDIAMYAAEIMRLIG